MPREQINYPDLSVSKEPSSPGAGVTYHESALHVSWHPDRNGVGIVQIAVEADPNYLRMAVDSPNELDGRTSVYTPVLERAELNKLIRVLKRARDQAYGRDE